MPDAASPPPRPDPLVEIAGGPTILVSPLRDAPALIASRAPSHVLSLLSPGGPELAAPGGGAALRLVFNDIPAPQPGLRPVREADIARLLEFSRLWRAERPLLIHCLAGVSRSPAAGFIVACDRGGPGSEEAAARALRAAAPFATPNARMIALADALLGRRGAMIAAARAIGRGRETPWGAPFVLLSPRRPQPVAGARPPC